MESVEFAIKNCIQGWDGISPVDGWYDLEYIDFVSNQSRGWNRYGSKGGWQRKIVRLEKDELTTVKRNVIWEESDIRRNAGRYAVIVKGMYIRPVWFSSLYYINIHYMSESEASKIRDSKRPTLYLRLRRPKKYTLART